MPTFVWARRLWQRLTEPDPAIKEIDQRRQAQLLAALLLTMIVLGIVLEAYTTITLAAEGYVGYRVGIAGILCLAVLYTLSRGRRYRLAGALTVTAIALLVFASAIDDPSSVPEGFLAYLLLPIWLGSVILNGRGLLALIVGTLAGLVAFAFVVPQVGLTVILIGPFQFVLISSALLIVLTRHRDNLEHDRRAELIEGGERLRREAARSAALLRVAGRLNATLDLDTLLTAISEETAQALGTPVASVWLYDDKHEVFYPAGGTGPPATRMQLHAIPLSLYRRMMTPDEMVGVVLDVRQLPDLPDAEFYRSHDVRTLVFASLNYEGGLIGSLNALSIGAAREFSEDERLLLRGLADQAALAIVNTRLYKDSRRRLEHLQALRAIDVAITSNRVLQDTLKVLLDKITQELQVDAALVLLLDAEKQHLEYAGGQGFHTQALHFTRLPVGQGHAGRAAERRAIVSIPDLQGDTQAFAHAPLLAQEGFVSYYAAPLIANGQLKGVLEIFHRWPLDPDAEWLAFLEALAGQAAIAIDSTTLFADLQRANAELLAAYDATIEGWSRALDLRDKETEGHTQRVTEMTLALARASWKFPETELENIRRGGLLHDIGKMGVPDNILNKPGPLTQAEWEVMRQHPTYAFEMLWPIAYLRPALDIPWAHHEKWDGTGYPRGLKGEAIPLAARLFAVVDVWDALRSDRPYRKGWPVEQVIAHLREGAGSHFDPQVVEAFLKILV